MSCRFLLILIFKKSESIEAMLRAPALQGAASLLDGGDDTNNMNATLPSHTLPHDHSQPQRRKGKGGGFQTMGLSRLLLANLLQV